MLPDRVSNRMSCRAKDITKCVLSISAVGLVPRRLQRFAFLLLWLTIPCGVFGQGVRFQHKPSTLYLHAWFPELGSLRLSPKFSDQILIDSAESAAMGKFKEAEALLNSITKPGMESMETELIAAMRRRVHELQYGDAFSAINRNGRWGDVALRQLEEQGNSVRVRPTVTGKGQVELDMLLDIETAMESWTRTLENINRQRYMAIITRQPWQPTTQGDAALTRFLTSIVRAQTAGELSQSEAELLTAEAFGDLSRASSKIPEAQQHYMRAFEIAGKIKSHRGELALSMRLGDLFYTPFGDPETLGWNLDTEWDLQGAALSGQNINPYSSSLSVQERRDGGVKWYRTAEDIRVRYFPDRFEARIGWRLYVAGGIDSSNFFVQVNKFKELALKQGDNRFGTFLWGSKAGSVGDRAELDRAVDFAFNNGDAFGAFRIFDYLRANALRSALNADSALANVGSLSEAFPVAVKYRMSQTAADIFFTLARLYSIAGQLERSIDFSRRAIEAYGEYLNRAKDKGTEFARNWLVLSYLQLSNTLMAAPGEVHGLEERLADVDAGISKITKSIKIDSSVIQPYETAKKVFKINQEIARAYGESASCSDYLKRLQVLAAEAHAAGFIALEYTIAAWAGQCGPAPTQFIDEVKGDDLAKSLLTLWRDYQTRPNDDATQRFYTKYFLTSQRLQVAIVQERFDVVDSFVRTMMPATTSDKKLEFMRESLELWRAYALCANGSCDEGASVLETLLRSVETRRGNLEFMIKLLYDLIDVRSRSGNVKGTLFALERLWYLLHFKEFARTGVSIENPESAYLDYLEKKSSFATVSLTKKEQEDRDLLRAAQRVKIVDLPRPQPDDLQQLTNLPPHTTLLVYHLAASAPVVVRVSSDGTALVKRLSVAPFEFTRLKTLLKSVVSKPAEGWESVSAELWKYLVEPVGAFPDGETMVIAAPSVMADIPFEALGPAKGDPLGARHPVIYLGRLLSSGPRTPTSTGRSVILGLVEGETPENETREIGRILNSDPFTNKTDPKQVESALRVASIIHISSHNISGDTNLYGSRLLIGREKEIMAWQLFGLIQSPNIVMLSGCQTLPQSVALLDSFARNSTGAHSGPRWVIGSRWDINDSAARQLTTAFYQSLRAGESPPVALEIARRGAIKDGFRHPYYWASFQMTAPDISSLR